MLRAKVKYVFETSNVRLPKANKEEVPQIILIIILSFLYSFAASSSISKIRNKVLVKVPGIERPEA